MPLTFIDIEKQKTWRIGMFFLILLILYFFVSLALVQGILFLVFPVHFIQSGSVAGFKNPFFLVVIFGFSLITAAIHFWFSASDAVRSVMKNLEAAPPDPDDGIHRQMKNIMDEIHVVTGRKRRIQCMVIPSLSMNAIAVADLQGNAAIGITEGLLSRLTRPQTEAVLAHEAYHILSGDCMEATVATSLFGMYAAMLEKFQNPGDDDEPGGLHPAFFLFWILVKFSHMLSLFISREREYRADAASVRMTRNPLALAESLHLIARNWRGAGMIGNGLEMLCIMNPSPNETDEREGFWANLMSTHPPIMKRIRILLNMVRVPLSELDKRTQPVTQPAGASHTPEPQYYAYDSGNQWKGPYTPAELAALPWLLPHTWIKSDQGKAVEKASGNPLLQMIFADRISTADAQVSDLHCPVCRQPLSTVPYERTNIYHCSFCRGAFVENTKIPRIIVRREKECTERIKSLAKAVTADNLKRLGIKKLTGKDTGLKPVTLCPKCSNPMLRTFYSLAYLVEIDRCSLCHMTWFDADELEMLQCLIENRMTAQIDFL
jgi:heat shock protein HtpX